MRLLPVSSLQPGMRLGKKIYNEEGIILLSENAELNDAVIRRLLLHGLDYVYVSDPRTDDVVVEDMIEESTRRKALQDIRDTFRKLAEPSVKGVVYPYLGKSFAGLVNSVMDDLSGRDDTMIMMMNINSMDHYLFRHSLNVCIYSLMLGIAQGYSKDELTLLGLGALLHDIGKTKLPLSILNKASALTEEEYNEIKRHPELGYKLLKDEPGISLKSAHCAYQHHERMDGSGYPRGLKGEEIADFARLIAITDTYDAMTTHRVYRSAMLPHEALEVLYTGCGTLYEKSKLELFRNHVAIYPLGITVTLNTGETGVVVKIHKEVPSRPIIRILSDADGVELKAPYDFDLLESMTTVIKEVDKIKP